MTFEELESKLSVRAEKILREYDCRSIADVESLMLRPVWARRKKIARELRALLDSRGPLSCELEPVAVSHEVALASLSNFADAESRADEDTLRALVGCGFRLVRACDLCAEPLPGRIPACPNVATVTVSNTRGRHFTGGPMHLCAPHARGEKVYVAP